jgi:hypothetical protein
MDQVIDTVEEKVQKAVEIVEVHRNFNALGVDL